ncbi:ATP-binding SpoIIE family protein phosphatase [Actinomadura sp. DC4]|uniref:ATP-binding SpoIIE family protein phosphatase n=1 Tax=Actinomadura sp. DC4 TaxID=3055069 RepID=UPI0025B1B13C|nr:ATP-binding SpoIIE family protein phosphatase [Actinomadura sp. DC4]MDN3351866.1 SpoIIE family protein phosphatase [Actinomadura sp. DC4]
MRTIVRAAYPADRTAVAQARRFVRETLIGWGADDAIDDAVLLTSELATNAVIHAGTPFEVICRAGGGSVQVEVVDGDTTRVLPAPGKGDDADRISGRGLLMPIMLAAEWGVSYAAGSKTVWFRLGTRATPALVIPGVEHRLVRPAGRPLDGDLYDVFEAAPGHWRFSVGGVCGTGPETATLTGLARHGLRLLAAEGHEVAAAVARLNEAILREGVHGRLMTLLHGELVRRPGAGVRLTLVSAGHPPPLRLTPSGEARSLTGTQRLLGAVHGSHFAGETVDLDPGELLVCVTGGAIAAAPDPDVARLLAGWAPPETVADCLRRSQGGAVLVIRVR